MTDYPAGRRRYLEIVEEKPEVRIGTSERERAQTALIEHFSQGRLVMPEFEQRSSMTAAARTVADLSAVFIDLPGGLPAALSAPGLELGRPVRRTVSWGALRAGLGPVVVVLLLLLGLLTGHGWLLVLILPLSGTTHSRRWAHRPNRLDGSRFHLR
ncbi:hypothetical protein ABIB25_005512 [Nakamurella sp. UYEF19]|uniref:DUF1707 SHOCT-like domain-containing protein n=1 Tax=Nakamurella sp. UYEF19 TaxID=1756392 RepID=UPI0033929D4F